MERDDTYVDSAVAVIKRKDICADILQLNASLYDLILTAAIGNSYSCSIVRYFTGS